MSMDKQQFASTFAALDSLQTTVLTLKESLERVQHNEIKDAKPPVNVADVVQKIEQVLDKINMVLNEDDASNNHN